MIKQFFLPAIAQQKSNVLRLALALAFLALTQMFFLFLIGPFLKALFLAQDPHQVISFQDIVPKNIGSYLPQQFNVSFASGQIKFYLPVLLLIVGTFRALAKYIYQYNHDALALTVAKSYREKLFATILKLPFLKFNQRTAGEWMSLIMNDVYYLQNRFSDFVSTFLRDGILILSCLLALTIMHWPTALFLVVLCPFVAKWLGSVGKRISFFAERWQREIAQLASSVLQVRGRFNLIRAERAEEFELKRFAKINTNYYRNVRKSLWVRSMFAPALEFWGFCVFALFVFAYGRGYWGESLRPEIMLQFLAALGLLLRPLKNFGEELTKFHETRGALQQSFALISAGDNAQGDARPRMTGVNKKSTFGNLKLAKINSGYNARSVFVAQDLQFERGKTYAIIGPSGSGKTTFLRTLAGIIEPMEWRANIDYEELRAHVSFVSQQPFLFDDTVRNNLLYGKEQETSANELFTIQEKLQTVNLWSEIERLPQGVQSRIKAINANFSGGQVQRLVIARALLKNASIWLLDEATSAIDAKTEKDILERLIAAAKAEQKILLAITHRLQWLSLFDEILFVENGKIASQEKYQSLVNNPRFNSFSGSIQL